ncbi:MAG: hypothetical protein J5485_00245 [Candidatus Methanomethylophilaceae archaeon]|nr:hypothetical protein [Candidatus Methanomethylophilaceae archaeon]
MTVVKSKDAVYEAETLRECVAFLAAEGVKWVNLKWTWSREIEIDAPDRWPFTHDGTIRARYVGNVIDSEYSYIGAFDVDVFREWADDYSCWDGADLAIVDGVLTGTVNEWDPDAKEFPEEDEEISVIEWEDLGLAYYEYWDADAGKWRVLP